MLTRCVMSTFDCQTKTPRQSNQACVGNCEKQCTDPWMQPNGGESITLKFWGLEDFPGISPRRGVPVSFLPQRIGDVHSGTRRWFFQCGPTEGAKACTENAVRCKRAEQSCDSGPGVVAVTDSEFLGQNTHIATLVNRVRA